MSPINKTALCLMFLAAILFLVPATVAVPVLKTSETNIVINQDDSVNWEVILNYSEPIEKSDYFIFARVYDVKVYSIDNVLINHELVPKEVGSFIESKDLLDYNTTLIRYTFRSNNQVSGYNSFRIFRHGLSITDNLERFSLTVKLPLGATLVDKAKLKGTQMAPFEPAFGQEGSDGQRILVAWELNRPKLGEPINIIILYENLQTGLEIGFVISIILVLVILSVLLTYYFRRIKVDMKSVLAVLSDGERKVMEIIIREKKVDQRIIVRETDFSKAKVSRIIQSLTARGMIDAIPKGRTKLITLKTAKRNLFQAFNKLRKRYKISKLRLSREQALELTQFLTSIIDDINKEAKEQGEYTKTKLIRIPSKLQPLYEDLKSLYPALDEKLRNYNNIAGKIEELIQKTKSIINKKHRKQFEDILREKNLNIDIAKDFPALIIDNKTNVDEDYKEFWQENSRRILKIRENRQIALLISDIEQNREEMEQIMWDVKDALSNLREEIRKSYNILVKEFYK
ncbi:MAG: hypothetical protein HZB65_03530 [Candidatus Aenigmarchaeota archaeon]|nr:hypothetical protein [Candidatus Aenigmarchaeota archaeon]